MGLCITRELDKKYSEACSLCRKKHIAIYGNMPVDCAFRHYDNEYCSDIETAERLRVTIKK